METNTAIQKKLALAHQCAKRAGYVDFKPIEATEKEGHYLVDCYRRKGGRPERKEMCVVKSAYTEIWRGICEVYLPTIQFLTPKPEVYMIVGSNVTLVASRWSLANVYQTKGPATLVINYYAQRTKNLDPLFSIDDFRNMPLGKKVAAEIVIQEKKNEKGRMLIVDVYVFPLGEQAKMAKGAKFMAVQKDLPSDFKSLKEFEVASENRKVFICERR
ncbi:MAG TPA: hypothetical protein PKI61_00640 [bacterium]|nr:hypothetical protein [bacterium]HPT29395.1 hypothetical protein [bacterium]